MKFVVLKPRHKLAQIFTNYLWAKWPVSQYFYIPLPICVPKNLSCYDNQYTTSPHQKTANQNRWGAHAVLLWLHTGWGTVFFIKDYQGNVRVVLNQANQPVEVNSYWSCCKGRKVTKSSVRI